MACKAGEVGGGGGGQERNRAGGQWERSAGRASEMDAQAGREQRGGKAGSEQIEAQKGQALVSAKEAQRAGGRCARKRSSSDEQARIGIREKKEAGLSEYLMGTDTDKSRAWII